MKKTILLIVVVAIAVFAYMRFSGTPEPVVTNSNESPVVETSPVAEIPQGASVPVAVKGYAFGPDKITVKVGTTVTWTNEDVAKHSVVLENGVSDGPLFGKGESYSYTFNKAGSFPYHCSPHPYMKGTVTVTE